MERIKVAVERAKAKRDELTERSSAVAHRRVGPAANLHEKLRRIDLPRRELEAKRILHVDGRDPRCAGFDILRTQVLRQMAERNWQVLGITSPTAGCGKTVLAVNLALSIVRQPERTVSLVDFDLRRPQIAAYLGISVEHDLLSVLNGKISLTDGMVTPDFTDGRLRIVTLRAPVSHSTECIVSKETMEFVRGLREWDPSGLIIFDLPPVLSTDDVLAFLPQLDCLVIVVAAGETTVREAQECERLLGGSHILGTVLNKADEGTPGNYY